MRPLVRGRPQVGVAFLVLATSLLAACSSSTTRLPDESAASALPDGQVSGVLRLTGGPAGTADRAAAGEVFAYRDANLRGAPLVSGKAGSNGRFRPQVPAGRYYLAGTSPEFSIDPKPAKPPCRATAAVDIAAGGTVIADVVCARR